MTNTTFREDLVTRNQGRFAHWQARESRGINLDVKANRQTFAERFEKFKRNGFVAATTLDAVQSPSTTKDREEWWNREFVAGEYGKSGKGYPQMPDDATPGKTLGQAMSGNRRTHRMNYKNGDIDLRMPSATAIKRFSGENGNPTFDVPVSVAVKGGAPKQGWVRVTKTGPHAWSASALGANDKNSEMLSEAVSAVLEARRPTMALHAAGDLLERRRAREAAEGQELQNIKSTFIDQIGYDEGSSTMATKIGDKMYGHTVPKSFFESVANSERPGTLFNKLIKQNVQTEVNRCDSCGRFSNASIKHTCPQNHKPVSGIGEEHLERARLRALHVASSRSGGVTPAAAANVLPAQPAPVTTLAPGAPPVPVKKTGLPAPRRDNLNAAQATTKPMPLPEARQHMDKLRDLKPGSAVLVDGKEMQVQPYTPEMYGDRDNKNVLKVGYGIGRYNQEVSVARLAAGYVDIQVPEKKPAQAAAVQPAPVKPKHLENPIMSQKAYFDEIQPLKEGARTAGYDLIANGLTRECEASTSTDTYMAHVSVDHEGTMKRFINQRPVEAFEDKHRKAQQLEEWTAKNVFAMARITDAEKRRNTTPVPQR